jgi:hypothetical protein
MEVLPVNRWAQLLGLPPLEIVPGAGGVAHVVESLPLKCKAVSSKPST